jgi:5-formyltetrahydrofolate cyclo-ligase
MNTQVLKQSLRQRIIASRNNISSTARVAYDAAIGQRILQMQEYREAHVVLAYMNFGSEFGSDVWLQQVLAEGKQLLLPKVNRETKVLDIYRVADLQRDLAPGVWTIREPQPQRCQRIDTLSEIDFILIPGVAFSRDGARLGYGGGFYDKLLARMNIENVVIKSASRVAAAYGLQLVEGIPQEITDRKVQWLVTENETIHCAATH